MTGEPVAALLDRQTIQSPTPPAHLVLGREGLQNAEKQLRSMLDDIERWRQTSLAADFQAA